MYGFLSFSPHWGLKQDYMLLLDQMKDMFLLFSLNSKWAGWALVSVNEEPVHAIGILFFCLFVSLSIYFDSVIEGFTHSYTDCADLLNHRLDSSIEHLVISFRPVSSYSALTHL